MMFLFAVYQSPSLVSSGPSAVAIALPTRSLKVDHFEFSLFICSSSLPACSACSADNTPSAIFSWRSSARRLDPVAAMRAISLPAPANANDASAARFAGSSIDSIADTYRANAASVDSAAFSCFKSSGEVFFRPLTSLPVPARARPSDFENA